MIEIVQPEAIVSGAANCILDSIPRVKPARLNSNIAMRRILTIILMVWLIPACKPRLSSFDKDVNALIKKQCTFEEPCNIRIGDATSFEWDHMYVFRPGILNSEAQSIVPDVSGFEGEFNRKIAFMKNGKQVRIDEAASVIEGEHTPPGKLFFDVDEPGNPDCLRFSREQVFRVTLKEVSRGTVYRLACVNCKSSPVFAN